ncbi:hypothetical protein AZI98_10225 [Aeribacillus pallidus]|uniref:Uncharacterized protein n=1 Tax=Aeribacillus pallidus TaxID=33936 RepID=A0A165XKW3_9BACI|nr:hypothetical protein AZI98_10225 [Aeribacillus pallidus]
MKHLSVEGFLNMDSYALYSFFRLAFDWLQFNFFLPDWYDPDELPRLLWCSILSLSFTYEFHSFEAITFEYIFYKIGHYLSQVCA